MLSAGSAAVTPGGRLYDNSQFGTHATYRGGFVYRCDRFRVRVAGGTGFKEPTFFENFAHGFVQGNPNLKPERSLSWEMGVERGAVAVTYFNQRFRDLIEFRGSPPPGESNYFNVGAAIADGVGATMSTTVATRVSYSLIYTYLQTCCENLGSTDHNGLFVKCKQP